MVSASSEIILLDNGSVKAAATRQLRKLAQQLQAASGFSITPISLRHADQVDAAELGGKPAQTLYPFLSNRLAQGQNSFLLIPLFFAKSGALTKYLSRLLEDLRRQFGSFDLFLADVVYPMPQGEDQLVRLLGYQLEQMQPTISPSAHVVLVDHGSPDQAVTAVRNHLADRLRSLSVWQNPLDEAVMERRTGAQYDFNGELLESVLRHKAQQGVAEIVLLMQFFLPGRHAGKGGDIEQICRDVEAVYPDTRIRVSPLVAESPHLIPLLQARLQQALAVYSC